TTTSGEPCCFFISLAVFRLKKETRVGSPASFAILETFTDGSIPRAFILSYWPCYLLCVPILLALAANAAGYHLRTVLLTVIFGLWIVRCLRHTFWTA